MKLLLLLPAVIWGQLSYAQSMYVKLVDSTVKEIEQRIFFYRVDSIHKEFDADSNLKKKVSLEFTYNDSRGKRLITVNEQRWQQSDTCSFKYFFKNNRLIKVSASILSGNKTSVQQFYFAKGRLVFPPYARHIFDVKDYLRKSKHYSKIKNRIVWPYYNCEWEQACCKSLSSP